MRSDRIRAGALALLALLAPLVSACVGANTPAPPQAPAATALRAAFAAEQDDRGSPGDWFSAIDLAAADASGPLAVEVVAGALHGLTADGYAPVSTSVLSRSAGAMSAAPARLGRAWERAGDKPAPGRAAVRHMIASAVLAVALNAGDLEATALWRSRVGCATAATVFGPTAPAPIDRLASPAPAAVWGALPASMPGVAPFASSTRGQRASVEGCVLDAASTSPLPGERIVIVDLENPRAQVLTFGLETNVAAALEVGGARVIDRRASDGTGSVELFARGKAQAGRLRAVVRLAHQGGEAPVAISVLDERGEPVKTFAPAAGARADAKLEPLPAAHALEARMWDREGRELPALGPAQSSPLSRDESAAVTVSAALLAAGRSAELDAALELRAGDAGDAGVAGSKQALPALLQLLRARALVNARDLPVAALLDRLERAFAGVLEAHPKSQEAELGLALATVMRRGAAEGPIAALTGLGTHGSGRGPGRAQLAAYEASVANRAGLVDLRDEAFEAVRGAAPGSRLLADLDLSVHARTPDERAQIACASKHFRASSACLEGKLASGDLAGASAELARLRALHGAPQAFGAFGIEIALRKGDAAAAVAAYEALPEGKRAALPAVGFAIAQAKSPAELAKLAARFEPRGASLDAPFVFGAASRLVQSRLGALGISGASGAKSTLPESLEPLEDLDALEAEGAKLVAADRAKPFLPGAGTAVLKHVVRASLAAEGLLRISGYDLRRVSGTTDVAGAALGEPPLVEGRGGMRVVRRRIHKKNGSVVEPDLASNAQQGAADLSQLETGDWIEQVFEGTFLPGANGQLFVDTPDLLPERTSVRAAELELRTPKALEPKLSLWAHARWGKPDVKEASSSVTRTWRVENQAPRRMEDSVPRAERPVALSFGTQAWTDVAVALRELVAGMGDSDPALARWAAARTKGAADDKAKIDRVVTAAGEALPRSEAGALTDIAALYGTASTTTLRGMLARGQGSRTFLAYRALRALGVPVEIVAAEDEPWTSSSAYPARAGRFGHPLLVAKPRGASDRVFLDLDTEGPPLPPGVVSPELRGRAVLTASGAIEPLVLAERDAADAVDLALVLDDKGDARGTLALTVRGRAAQSMREAFETVVGSDRRRVLEAVVLGWLPRADVDSIEATPAADPRSPEVTVKAQVTIKSYGQPSGRDGRTWVLPGLEPVHAVFPFAHAGTLTARYASSAERTSALAIDASLLYRATRSVTLPASVTITAPPVGMKREAAGLVASREPVVEGRVIRETFALSLATGTIDAAGYGAFVAALRDVDDGFLAGARVKAGP